MTLRLTAIAMLAFASTCVTLLRATDKPDTSSSPFEGEICAFEESDGKERPPENGIVFVGSSSIRLWKSLKEDFKGLTVINRGFGGSQVADSTRYADRIVLPYKPRQVVLYAGDNDIASGRTPGQVLADFKAFVEKVRTALPETRVTFIAIKASNARWNLADKIKEANRLVSEFTETEGGDDKLDFVDVFTPMLGEDGKPRKELLVEDGLHLSAKGYELWAAVVRPHLRK